MEDKINELEARVAHLERELETSYEEEQFKRAVKQLFPDDASIEFKDGRYGYYAEASNITGDDVQTALDRIENRDGLGAAVTETALGIGMEVWSEEDNF